jgi:DNA-binding CsgD family transcriptional regulator
MRWPLAGREAELGFLAETLAEGSAGGVVVTGAAGVGKTRLAHELAALAGSRGREVAWVRATRSAASIPLGAFAGLLPATVVPAGAGLLAHAREALAGRRLVLCVDDAHALDDASAALVHGLVAAGDAFAVVTVRRGEAVPDAVRALWKDELCAALELGALSRAEVGYALAAALGGPVDGPTLTGMWELTRGNALFLRELVRHGVDRGALAEDAGVWRWRGAMQAGTRLAELVDLRVAEAGGRARELLELVAVGGPLELALLGDREALGELEALELVERRADGRRRLLDLVHPLHGEAVRARLTASRLDAVRLRLADAVAARGARRTGDLLRVATWRLDAGAPDAEGLFTRAALRALSVPDPPLAERLARAATGPGAGLALGRALAAAGRGAEAEAVLAALPAVGDDATRATVALARARNLLWALDRGADAEAVLRDAERAVADADLRHELAAQRSRLQAAQGRPRAALAAARPLLDDPGVPERARATAAIAAVEGLLTSGRTEEALTLAGEWLPVARRLRDELPHAEPVLGGMRGLALRLAGRIVEATTLSEGLYEELLARRASAAVAVEANMLGLTWLARGRVRTAMRLCRESAALQRDADGTGMLAFALAGVAQAAAQAGQADAARAAVAEMRRTRLGHGGFAVEVGLAQAWSAAATGELSRARALARGAAELARERGQDAYAARALHDLCRLGDPAGAAPRLGELAARVDGPFAGAAAAHAVALRDRDGAALLAAAERFAAEDALLVAAEAAQAAAVAHRDAGRSSSARTAEARAGLWLTRCEGARAPTLPGPPDAAGLTPREREIALLAASGSTSREIADRLVVSVRTVDNHLHNAYRKLGVTRRTDLEQALG